MHAELAQCILLPLHWRLSRTELGYLFTADDRVRGQVEIPRSARQGRRRDIGQAPGWMLRVRSLHNLKASALLSGALARNGWCAYRLVDS